MPGDSKSHPLGFLFPRPDLLGGVAPPTQRSMFPETLVAVCPTVLNPILKMFSAALWSRSKVVPHLTA